MRIIALSTLRVFWMKHPNAEIPLRSWYALASRAQWKSPLEIKEAFRNASFTGNNRVIFNIKGNDYRLVVMIRYDKGLMYIRFIGTHIEYDKIDVVKI
jgi:mRNA interferase HigB